MHLRGGGNSGVAQAFRPVLNFCHAELDSASQIDPHPSFGHPLPEVEGKKCAFTLAEVFSPCRKAKLNFGFTLAETLITLGIIGIVAAITIPQLVSNYKKHVTVNKLKYVYSLLKNAEQAAIAEYGDMTGWKHFNNPNFFDEYYYSYIKISKCDYKEKIHSSAGIRYYNGFNNQPNARCLPNNIVLIGRDNGYFGHTLYIDLNGVKKPNIMGKDVFMLLINRPVYKSGDYNTDSYRVIKHCPVGLSTCFGGEGAGAEGHVWDGKEESLLDYCIGNRGDVYSINTIGNSCAYMIQQAGWKIPDNYPIKF